MAGIVNLLKATKPREQKAETNELGNHMQQHRNREIILGEICIICLRSESHRTVHGGEKASESQCKKSLLCLARYGKYQIKDVWHYGLCSSA